MRSKGIHRHTVHTQLNKDIKRLGTPPPKIAEKEQTLPLTARIRLTQLRTGYCPLTMLITAVPIVMYHHMN